MAQAESNTSGEIVPLIVPCAGDYEHVEIRFGAFLSMALTLLALWWAPMIPLWGIAGVMAASYLLGRLVVRITPGLKHFLVGKATMNDTVSEKSVLPVYPAGAALYARRHRHPHSGVSV